MSETVVEKHVDSDSSDSGDEVEILIKRAPPSGFPRPETLNWKQLAQKVASSSGFQAKEPAKEEEDLLSSMSEAEILEEKARLESKLDPKNIEFLRKRHAERQQLLDNEPKLPPSIHFPPIPAKALGRATDPNVSENLDANDKNFLEQLHSKFFPDLEYDPEKLSWMQMPTEEEDRMYHPDMKSVAPGAIRFDFQGNILPPRTSREIPVTAGLHHHADAPNAAGYTIPELAHLARSRFPAQRAIAIRTLGRILYKLGSNVYGKELSEHFMALVKNTMVLRTIEEFAQTSETHLGVRSYAIEALWLWHQTDGSRISSAV